MSLIELMVGLTLGLLVVAAALAALGHQVRESRRVLLSARLLHDLRSVSDLIARDVGRAGHWFNAATPAPPDTHPPRNPYSELDVEPAQVSFLYARHDDELTALDAQRISYRLHEHTVQLKLGQGSWQPLSDPLTVRITRLTFSLEEHVTDLGDWCRTPCADASVECPPRARTRLVELSISAHPPHAPALERHVQARVPLRNNVVTGQCSS